VFARVTPAFPITSSNTEKIKWFIVLALIFCNEFAEMRLGQENLAGLRTSKHIGRVAVRFTAVKQSLSL
jgi:hypothetical protein